MSYPFFYEFALFSVASTALLCHFYPPWECDRVRAASLVFGLGLVGCICLSAGGEFTSYSVGPCTYSHPCLRVLQWVLGGSFFLVFLLSWLLLRACSLSLVLGGFIAFALVVALVSGDWFFLWVCLELGAILSYLLVSFSRTAISVEASFRYFSVGLVSSSLLLMGIVLILWVTPGSSLLGWPYLGFSPVGIGTVATLTLVPLLIKLGVAPFHFWVPDVYEGSSAFTTMLLSTALKLGWFFLLVKVAHSYFICPGGACGIVIEARWLFGLSSAISMLVGGLGGLSQGRIKRLLAYSSVGNAGFALCGLAEGTVWGAGVALAYMVVYLLSVLISFAFLLGCRRYYMVVGQQYGWVPQYGISFVTDVARLRAGGASISPLVFSMVLFSLASVPPLAGFWAKFFMLQCLFSSGELGSLLATYSLVYGVVSSFYYLNLIKILYSEGRAYPRLFLSRGIGMLPYLVHEFSRVLGGPQLSSSLFVSVLAPLLLVWVLAPYSLYRFFYYELAVPLAQLGYGLSIVGN